MSSCTNNELWQLQQEAYLSVFGNAPRGECHSECIGYELDRGQCTQCLQGVKSRIDKALKTGECAKCVLDDLPPRHQDVGRTEFARLLAANDYRCGDAEERAISLLVVAVAVSLLAILLAVTLREIL